jgi:predicted DNA-binding protein
MKRTTVKLPDDLDARLRREARRRGTTISELTREAIEAHLSDGLPRRFLAAGAGRSGQRDVSERIEEILREELGS